MSWADLAEPPVAQDRHSAPLPRPLAAAPGIGAIGAGLVLATAVLVVLVQVASAISVLPMPHTDAIAFLSAAIDYRATGLLVQVPDPVSDPSDPTGASRFLFHGPLFPWLVGSLMREATPRGALVVIAAFRGATLLGFAAVALLLLRRHAGGLSPARRRALVATAIVFLLAQAGMRLPPVGRPEALGEAIALLGACCLGLRAQALGLPLMALALGVMGTTQPAGAALLGAVFAAALAWRLPPRRALCAIIGIALAGTALALLIIAASPNGMADTLAGIGAHFGNIAARTDGGLLLALRYLFLWWDRCFFFAFVILAAGYGLPLAWRRRAEAKAAWLVWAAVGSGLALAWALAIRVPPTSYNLAQFTPVVLLVLLRLATMLPRPDRLIGLAVAAGLASSLALVKYGVEAKAAWVAGTTYDTARAEVRRLLPGDGCVVVDQRSWVLSDDRARLRLGPDQLIPAEAIPDCPRDAPLRFLLVPEQAEACRPAGIAGEVRVLLDQRRAAQPSLFGVPVTRFPAGYGYCIGAFIGERRG